jgi:hypothetical protein
MNVKPSSGTRGAQSGNPWHAVSVAPGVPACLAAAKVRGQRFLAAEAPRLPLPDCTLMTTCKCTYKHFADRRAGTRRAADRGMLGRYVGPERRAGRSRRAEDADD